MVEALHWMAKHGKRPYRWPKEEWGWLNEEFYKVVATPSSRKWMLVEHTFLALEGHISDQVNENALKYWPTYRDSILALVRVLKHA